ncbi:MAG: CoA transferase [Anaerolineaceae bacterium]
MYRPDSEPRPWPDSREAAVTEALSGVRVLDVSTSVSGAWCSRMLADFGADVLIVEPPAGHPLRGEPPFDDSGQSIAASWFLANKRSVALDLREPWDWERFSAFAAKADVVVSSYRPSQLRALGLEYEHFDDPRLVLCHITPYGMTGARAEDPANELTVAALSGWASLNGEAARYPLKPSGHQVGLCTGTAAYAAIIAALIHRGANGERGQEIDIAELDVMVSAASPAILRGQYLGTPVPRRESVDITSGPVPVADGYFSLTISRAHFWRDAMTVLGLHDLAEDQRWESAWYRAAHRDEYIDRVGAAMSTWTRAELFDELAARRVVAGPVLTMEELRSNEHLAERGFWTETPEGTFPGAPFRMSATPWRLRDHAPAQLLPEAGWGE